MKPALLLALLCVAACTPAPFVKTPPAKYRQPAIVWVSTHPTGDMPTVCAGASTEGEPAGPLLACFRGIAAHMPNPCEWPDDPYAELLCHEFGHAQGWPGNHPDQ